MVLFTFLIQSVVVSAAPGGGFTAPSKNVDGPLNTGSATQDKAGSLHITAGGFRVWGPALFDDIVIIGYTTGMPTDSQTQTGYLQKNKKEGFLAKLSKFFGFNSEKALADLSNPSGPGLPTPTGFPGSCGSSNGGSFSSAPTTNLCDVGNSSSVGLVGSTWSWSCDTLPYGNFAPAICSANKVGVLTPSIPTIPTIPSINYILTVNGNTNISSNATIGGETRIESLAGNGIKEVCIDSTGKLIYCP